MLKLLTKNIFFLSFLFVFEPPFCQTPISGIVNQYYKVLSVNSDSNFVQVDSLFSLNEGDRVLLIQMQGATIDESQSSSFGTISDYSTAGNYEFQTVCHTTENLVYFENTLLNNYNANQSVQLVFVPHYSHVVLEDTLTGMPWNGTTGGVLAIDVDSILDLDNYSLDMSAKGFQGAQGAVSGSDCSWLSNVIFTYYQNFETEPWSRGRKGEGVAKIIPTKECGIGPQANGGGGGNNHNGGAGGGSNFGIGGGGGERIPLGTFNCNAPPGLPSISLNAGYNSNKIFLGGGGGAGHGNNEGIAGENGGNGGGIIFINAHEIISDGQSIRSYGQSVIEGSTDGGAGGGAGGTIVFNVDTIIGDLSLEVFGGNGASTINGGASNCNGPGGGGGGGAILTTHASLPVNVSTTLEGGISGIVAATNQTNCVVGSKNMAEDGTVGGILTNWNWNQSQEVSVACQPPCLVPDAPVFNSSTVDICQGDSTTISIVSGELNGADFWVWHVGQCDGEIVGTGENFLVSSVDDATYFIAGEGGCITDEIPICSVVHLMTHPAYENFGNTNLCEGEQVVFNGETISESGVYTINLLSQYGCDSITNLEVTVTEINSEISQNQYSLNALQSNATYQWLDCDSNQVLVDETAQEFFPQVNGNYAVEVFLDNCSETSDCVYFATDVSIEEAKTKAEIMIYPNPTFDEFYIDLGDTEKSELLLYDSLGKLVLKSNLLAQTTNSISVRSLPSGTYFGRIVLNNKVLNFKLMIR